MIETYIHMSPMEQDRVMLKHAGVISDEESRAKERRVTGHMCSVCHMQNSSTSRYCCGCGEALTNEAAIEDRMINSALAHPKVLQRILEKMAGQVKKFQTKLGIS